MRTVEANGATFAIEEIEEVAGSSDAPALVCLHSGWGRAVMPFDEAAARLSSRYRIVFPDRRGYGRSTPLDRLPLDFHERAAHDLDAILGELAIERPVLWGHSDGAVIAALWASRRQPRALVLEAIHYYRAKSRDFFARYAREPESLPAATRERLAADHGDRWPTVVRMHSQVWLDFHGVGGDFYGERLAAIACPTLLVHGANEPHTPVSEVEEVARRIPGAELFVVPGGGHSPHSEPGVAAMVVDRVAAFLGSVE